MSYPVQNQNQFAQTPMLGAVVKQPSVDTETCQINPNTSASQITAGCAVKLIANSGPETVVDVTSSPSDGPVFGVIAYNRRKNIYGAAERVEVASMLNVVWCYSGGAISRGQRVSVTNPSSSANAPTVNVDSTAGDYTLGVAETQATAAGQMVAVRVNPGQNIVPNATSTCVSVISP